MTIWLIRGRTSLRSMLMLFLSGLIWVAKLAAGRALRVHVERIDRMARRHEQPVALDAAEANVGGPFGQHDLADAFAVGREHDDAVVALAHPPAAPQIAVDVAAEAVRRLALRAGDEDAAVGELRAVVDHVEDADHAWREPGLDDVHPALVRREAESVWAVDVAGHDRGAAAPRIEPVDVGGQFRLVDVALVVAEDAERR